MAGQQTTTHRPTDTQPLQPIDSSGVGGRAIFSGAKRKEDYAESDFSSSLFFTEKQQCPDQDLTRWFK